MLMLKNFYPLKKLILAFIFNFSVFIILMIGIQNSSSKTKLNLIINETVSLPVSFIIGISFLTGSISGNLINLNFLNKN